MLAMVVQQQDQNKKAAGVPTKGKSTAKAATSLKATNKEKKMPPFVQQSGKLGDMKQWNGKTYYFCLANHK